jgi:hypothetical protein
MCQSSCIDRLNNSGWDRHSSQCGSDWIDTHGDNLWKTMSVHPTFLERLLLFYSGISKDKTYIWVSVWWKTKNWSWGIYVPHIHWKILSYCKTYLYWQASNTVVHYAFISRGRGPPPDLFPVTGSLTDWQTNDFFFLPFGAFLMKKWLETTKPDNRGEFESTTGSVQGKDHERCRSLFHQPLACWRITGSGCTKYWI